MIKPTWNKPWTNIYVLMFMFFLTSSGEVFSQCSQLVWQDEFNTSSLDLTKWSYQTGTGTNDNLPGGWGNNELQYYTSRTQNVNVTGGNLELTALYEPNYLGTGVNYTSGRIRSTNPITNNPRNEWQYGSFEARIKVPTPYADSRAWPGFWMLPHNGPWPNTGEIDIMETGNNNNPWYYNGTLHYGTAYPGNTSGTGGVTLNTATSCPAGPVGDLSVCFHVYRVDWTPNSIKFFVDNVQVGATQSNTTVGSAGVIGAQWPFDGANPFHMIFNMAVGGYFPGSSPINNARFPLKMQVDYVRVYSTPAAVKINGKTKILQGKTGVVYSVSNVGGNTYSWTVPTGATIASGQGTNQITVDYGASAVSGNVSVTITPTSGTCVASTNSLPVSVLPNACTITLENFETASPPTRNLGFNFATGWLNRTNTSSPSFPFGTFANPNASGVNVSANVGKYERNAGATYDVLAYNDIVIGDAVDFKNGIVKFNMDVYSTAPAGTTVMIQLENSVSAQTGWPNGIYSRFTAVTGATNAWSTLQFTLLDSPDAVMSATAVDQIVILFNPNTNTNHTYYFDNFKRAGVTPTTSAITGSAAVCLSSAGVNYSVTGFSTSTYAWTVPAGSTIVSGQGTNAITVNFGTTSGNVSVTETSAAKCAGTTKNLAVTVSGTCTLLANFSASILNTCAGGKIVFTDLTTGKTGAETYSWDFGAGASLPAGTTGAGPFNVSYSTGGTKTVVLTVSRPGSTNTQTKTNYITISAPPTGCLFNDDYNNATVNWIAPIPGAFSHAEAGTAWTVSNAGYGEWEFFNYTLNNGSTATPLNFACASTVPVVKIRAKASANCLLRLQLMDGNGLATDNVPGFNMELTTTYQTFTISYATFLRNFYGTSPGYLDSTNITKLQLFINPGYISYPFVGVNKTYNTSFAGTVDIDWIGIGNNCNFPGTAPTITSFTPTCGAVGSSVTITGTNLAGATNVSFNGVTAAVTGNTATQIIATVPAGVSNGKISVTNSGGTVISAANFNLAPTTSVITGLASVCANTAGVTYSVTATAGSTYAWTVPTGASITSATNTNSITVTFGTANGNIAVTETNTAGCVGTQIVKAVTVNAKPTTTAITGLASVCANATGVTYSVTATAGSTYAWTVPTGASITSATNTNSITVTFGTANGNIAVTETNTAGCVGTQIIKAVTVNAKPTTTAITGLAAVCANATGVTYSVTTTAGSTYAWTVPTGASITSATNTNSITVTFGTANGNIAVTETNAAGCVGTQIIKAVTVNAKPTTTAITGLASTCANATGVTYSVTATAGSTYTWTVPAGASITSATNTNSITVTFGTASGNIAVTETNTAGCVGTQIIKAVTVNALPTTSAITGLASTCANTTGVAYSVTTTAGSTYAWTVPAGASIFSGTNTNSILVNFGTANGNIAVTETNAAGCVGTQIIKAVTVNARPSTAAVIGLGSVCVNATGVTYSVTATAGSTYAWTIPSGASITSATNTNSITVTFGTANGNITVIETNTAGCTGTQIGKSVVVNAKPTTTTITGLASVCANATGVTYSVTATAGSTYAWTVPTGASITSATNTNSITVSFGSSNGNIAVTETNTAGCVGTQVVKAVVVNAKPTTTTITGLASVCANATGVTYSVTATAGSTYAWTVPTGASITSATNTNSITVTFGTANGSIAVTETNTAGCVGTQVVKAVTVNAKPTTTAITGLASVCANATGVTYSVTATAGSTYAWTVPTGASITSATNTNSITVTFGTANGDITVTETNTAGCGGTQVVKAVTVNAKPTTTAITGLASVCANATGVTYSVTATAGSTYAWTVPTGASITSATNTNSIIVTFGTANGNIAVTETNAAGCVGTQVVKAVTVNAKPSTTAITGNTSPGCNATGIVYSVTTTAGSTYAWTVPAGATITAGTNTNSITVSFGSSNGNIAVTETNAAGCAGITKTSAISLAGCGLSADFSGAPLSICVGSTVTYTNLSTGTSGSTTYSWNFGAGATPATASTVGPHTVTYTTAGSKTVSLQITEGATTTNTKTNYVTVNAKPVTSAITGNAAVCANATGVAYSVTTTAGSTYAWTVPAGATITAGVTTNAITVTFGTTGGNVAVTETNAAGCIGTQVVKAVTINALPTTSSITGNTTPACNAAGIVYSVTATAGSTYAWTIPAGASITSATNTNSITVSFGTTNGNITVTETNIAGCVGTTQSSAISLAGCGLAADFNGTPLSICAGETVTFTNSSTGTSGSTTYSWNFGAGATPATASTVGPHTVTYTTAGTKTISLQITEGATTNVTKTNYVTVTAMPSTANAGGDQNITTSTATLGAANPTVGTGTWTLQSGTGNIISANNPTTTITGLTIGANTFVWTVLNGTCSSTDQVTINVSSSALGPINGPNMVDVNSTYTYSVTASGSLTWTVPTGASIVSGQGTNTISVLFTTATVGDVTVSDDFATATLTVTVNTVTGVTSFESGNYSLSPNPFQEDAMLRINSTSNSRVHLKVIDMRGVVVYSSESFSLNEDIVLGKELISGVYTAIVSFDDMVLAVKLIKTE